MNFIAGLIIVIVILGVILFIVWAISSGRITQAPNINVSKKTMMNAGWLFGSYLIVLWAFALIWPNAWKAWSGSGFWVSQLAFLAMIGILSSVWIKTNGLSFLALIPLVFAVILTVTTIQNNFPEQENEDKKDKEAILPPPDVMKSYNLTKDDAITIYMVGYKNCSFCITADPFWFKPENGEARLIGGSYEYPSLESVYSFKIWAFEEEIFECIKFYN